MSECMGCGLDEQASHSVLDRPAEKETEIKREFQKPALSESRPFQFTESSELSWIDLKTKHHSGSVPKN